MTKIWIIFADGTKSALVMPSLLAPGSWSKLEQMRTGTRKECASGQKNMVISQGGMEYFAGALAAAEVREVTVGRGDELRSASEEALLRYL